MAPRPDQKQIYSSPPPPVQEGRIDPLPGGAVGPSPSLLAFTSAPSHLPPQPFWLQDFVVIHRIQNSFRYGSSLFGLRRPVCRHRVLALGATAERRGVVVPLLPDLRQQVPRHPHSSGPEVERGARREAGRRADRGLGGGSLRHGRRPQGRIREPTATPSLSEARAPPARPESGAVLPPLRPMRKKCSEGGDVSCTGGAAGRTRQRRREEARGLTLSGQHEININQHKTS